ncbi:CpaF/VirB11 family protein [Bacillus sp. T9C1]|uniref:CpaF/VirB11 family protein n=1 Tax=Bacillus sp. T9C1 TaxID=2918912 RepID=UPI00227EC724|nr:CpaF/VirB11 family protein [Bacillus sp. T9C1]
MKELIDRKSLDDILIQLKKDNISLYLAAFTDEKKREELKEYLLDKHKLLMSREGYLDYAIQELVGLGFIESLMKDEDITDISYNATHLVVESNTKGKYKYPFDKEKDPYFIDKVIQKFASASGGELTPNKASLNATLQKLRLNAIHQHNSPYGATMSLRATRARLALNDDNFHEFAPLEMQEFFEAIVKMRCNIFIAGETGTGKTELQKYLMSHIPFEERILLIEEVQDNYAKELFPEKDIFSWITNNNMTITQLIKAGLRNHPVWMIIAETLGEEAYEIMNAILTGHKLITTLHSVDARAIPKRMLKMAKVGPFNVDDESFLEDFYRYVQLGVHIKKRKINGIVQRYLSEVVEYHSDGTATTIFKQTETVTDELRTDYGKISSELMHRMIEFRASLPEIFLPEEVKSQVLVGVGDS